MNQLLLSIALFSTFCAFYGQEFGIPFATDEGIENIPVSPECMAKLKAGVHVCQERVERVMNHSSIRHQIDEAAKNNEVGKVLGLTFQLGCCVGWDALDCVMELGKKCTRTADQDALKLVYENATMEHESGICAPFKRNSPLCKQVFENATNLGNL